MRQVPLNYYYIIITVLHFEIQSLFLSYNIVLSVKKKLFYILIEVPMLLVLTQLFFFTLEKSHFLMYSDLFRYL